MHDAAAAWLNATIRAAGLTGREKVVDFGGRDVNGTIHGLFKVPVTVLDVRDGPGVDIVADAADWEPDQPYDVVLCTEVFEHTPRWQSIIRTARHALTDGGFLIATCASRDRPPHSAIDGGPLRDGEYYRNVDPAELTGALRGFSRYAVYAVDGYFGNDDLYCWAER